MNPLVWIIATLAVCAVVHRQAFHAGRKLAYRDIANSLELSGNKRLAQQIRELD